MTVSDYTNSGIPQLYMKTDKGFECVDISENTEQISNQNNREFQETSVLYQFCINKLQVKYCFEYIIRIYYVVLLNVYNLKTKLYNIMYLYI